ncbi:hypothetical protein P153DRAFT_382276 [Dothidotthia symphoricarpi CBS 119687]|uniref:Anaphase-promoting complex, subunit CDC26 n=1 Tax=Dothidotthia symphoricarpi CBS 119687 TaxID=1392245 RepID=A0A6A6AP42_9PLEO|nr:uncharacterized protein P153DRAFT_382276 [Dothidotthia symphoricarpi CBS 119687]KAF2132657.1 hypothetical protein P153DRAFT_382276 [Dothidotthia symphoricarpi CBS 119687]
MLRRAPTTISLTANDIEQYDANRKRKLWEAQQQQEQQQQQQASSNAAKEKIPSRGRPL